MQQLDSQRHISSTQTFDRDVEALLNIARRTEAKMTRIEENVLKLQRAIAAIENKIDDALGKSDNWKVSVILVLHTVTSLRNW